MRKILIHLLLPFTALLWNYVCYYIIYGVVIGLIFVFNFHWLLLLFTTMLSVAAIIMIVSLPVTLNDYLLGKFYNFSWLSVIAHGVLGVIGVYNASAEIYSKFYFRAFWDVSQFKTTLLLIPVITVFYIIIHFLIIKPFFQNYYIDKFGVKRQG